MLERFESGYLVTIRVIFSLVVLVAFLTLVGSVLWYGLARITAGDHQTRGLPVYANLGRSQGSRSTPCINF